MCTESTVFSTDTFKDDFSFKSCLVTHFPVGVYIATSFAAWQRCNLSVSLNKDAIVNVDWHCLYPSAEMNCSCPFL